MLDLVHPFPNSVFVSAVFNLSIIRLTVCHLEVEMISNSVFVWKAYRYSVYGMIYFGACIYHT